MIKVSVVITKAIESTANKCLLIRLEVAVVKAS